MNGNGDNKEKKPDPIGLHEPKKNNLPEFQNTSYHQMKNLSFTSKDTTKSQAFQKAKTAGQETYEYNGIQKSTGKPGSSIKVSGPGSIKTETQSVINLDYQRELNILQTVMELEGIQSNRTKQVLPPNNFLPKGVGGDFSAKRKQSYEGEDISILELAYQARDMGVPMDQLMGDYGITPAKLLDNLSSNFEELGKYSFLYEPDQSKHGQQALRNPKFSGGVQLTADTGYSDHGPGMVETMGNNVFQFKDIDSAKGLVDKYWYSASQDEKNEMLDFYLYINSDQRTDQFFEMNSYQQSTERSALRGAYILAQLTHQGIAGRNKQGGASKVSNLSRIAKLKNIVKSGFSGAGVMAFATYIEIQDEIHEHSKNEAGDKNPFDKNDFWKDLGIDAAMTASPYAGRAISNRFRLTKAKLSNPLKNLMKKIGGREPRAGSLKRMLEVYSELPGI